MSNYSKTYLLKSEAEPVQKTEIDDFIQYLIDFKDEKLIFEFDKPIEKKDAAKVFDFESFRYGRLRKKADERGDNTLDAKRLDRLELEMSHHKQIVDLKLQGVEERLESKIDSSLNQILSAINNVESRMNDKMNTIETNTIREINDLKNQALTLNDVKVTIAEEIRNSSNLKHTRSGVYIAAVAGIVSVVALLFQIFG